MKKHKEHSGLFVWILCILYIALLIWIILFKLNFFIKQLVYIRSVNLIPYGYSRGVEGIWNVRELRDNILIFIPFGIYLRLLSKKMYLWRNLAIIAGFSLALEILQYIFAIGVTDITDLINNTLGGLIGLLFSAILLALFGKKGRIFLTTAAFICSILFVAYAAIILIANMSY